MKSWKIENKANRSPPIRPRTSGDLGSVKWLLETIGTDCDPNGSADVTAGSVELGFFDENV
jgi:hypothetical protein